MTMCNILVTFELRVAKLDLYLAAGILFHPIYSGALLNTMTHFLQAAFK